MISGKKIKMHIEKNDEDLAQEAARKTIFGIHECRCKISCIGRKEYI
jgi:hypothetical protein